MTRFTSLRLATMAGALAALAACSENATSPTGLKPGASAHRDVVNSASLFHKASEKYSDKGAHPATGRDGSASLQSRALLAKDGTILIEATTGHLDASSAPGNIDKAQLKLINTAGDAIWTKNFNGLKAGGSFSTTMTGIGRGAPIQVQTNIGGIDRNRTDVVTVKDTVKLRPDVSVQAIQAVSRAMVNTQVHVGATIKELNGDVGATSSCVLKADGAEVDRVDGVWVDAGDAVSCAFVATFTTVGQHTLTVEAQNVVPGDYDAANNSASQEIEIVEPTINMAWSGGAYSYGDSSVHSQTVTINDCTVSYWNCTNTVESSTNGYTWGNSAAWFSAWTNSAAVTFPASVSFTATSGDSTLISRAGTMSGSGCAYSFDYATATWTNLCGWGTYTGFNVQRYTGKSTYYSAGVRTGYYHYTPYICDQWSYYYDWWYGYYAYCSAGHYGDVVTIPADYSWSYNYDYWYYGYQRTLLPLGSSVKMALDIQDAAGQHFVAGGSFPIQGSSNTSSSPFNYNYATGYTYTVSGTNTYASWGFSGNGSGVGLGQ